MKKIILLSLALFTFTAVIQSQSRCKEVVFIEYFSSVKNIENAHVKTFRNSIIDGIIKTERVLLKDVDSELSLKREEQKQTEDASSVDVERLVVMKKMNAKYLIQGHLSSLTTEQTKAKEGEPVHYRAKVTYSLKIIDVETGVVKGTESYSNSSLAKKTTKEAIIEVINAPGSNMKAFINKHFPIEGTILEINSEKKGA